MPNGPVEYTQHGPTCALCGAADPDPTHLNRQHIISSCVGKFKEPLRKSRRTDMIRHLAEHRIHSEAAATLADRWRIHLNKKFFSCGLCLVVFSSITERSNHIDNEHWRHGQNMDAWKLSNVIKGLLLEPEMQTAWRMLLSSYPNVVESGLRWEMPRADGLQLRLEKREEPTPVLAKAALQLSDCKRIRSDREGLIATMGRVEAMCGPVSVVPRSPAATTVASFTSHAHQSSPIHTQLPASMTLRPPRSLSPSNVTSFNMELPELECDPSLTAPAILEDPWQPHGFLDHTLCQVGSLMDASVDDSSSQLSTRAWPTEWQSMDTSQPIDDTTGIKGHLSEDGALLVAQMSAPRHEQSGAYACIDGQRPTLDSRRDVNTSNTIRLPTSTFFYASCAQPPNHEYGFNFRNKPLPPEPPTDLRRSAGRAPEHRPTTPMDLTTG